MGLADQAGDEGNLSRRAPSTGWSATAPAASSTAASSTQCVQDTQSLQPKISRGDSAKLDEYLESIRDIEKRIDRRRKEERIEGWRPTLAKPDMPRPKDELPQNVPDHMKLMLDLIVLAFQMDKTRIATLMLNNDLSQMNFKFLEGVKGALHLDLTHNGNAPRTRRRCTSRRTSSTSRSSPIWSSA